MAEELAVFANDRGGALLRAGTAGRLGGHAAAVGPSTLFLSSIFEF